MEIELLEVRETSGDMISSPEMVLSLMSKEAKADRECLWVLHLNSGNKLIEKELVSMGTVDSSLVHPREVFKKAIMNGAVGIITVHNHPSGSVAPSKVDKSVWEELDKAGDILGIDILDHIIISPAGILYSNKGGKDNGKSRQFRKR